MSGKKSHILFGYTRHSRELEIHVYKNTWNECYTRIHGMNVTQEYMEWMLHKNTWNECYTRIHGMNVTQEYMEWMLHKNTCLKTKPWLIWEFWVH